MSVEPVRDGEVNDHALVFREGEFTGRELEELFDEALTWWDERLTQIENTLDRAN